MPHNEITIDGTRYLHVRDAARFAHVVSDYKARVCREGTVRGVRVGGAWRADELSLNAFMRDREQRKLEHRRMLAALRTEERRQAGIASATERGKMIFIAGAGLFAFLTVFPFAALAVTMPVQSFPKHDATKLLCRIKKIHERGVRTHNSLSLKIPGQPESVA